MIACPTMRIKYRSGAKVRVDTAAYHEAGHALAALWGGRRVHGIGVSELQPGNGICGFAKAERNPFNVALNAGCAKAAWAHTLKQTEAEMRVALAGPLSEAKALGKPLRSLRAKADFDKCLYMSVRLIMLESFVVQFAKINFIDFEEVLGTQKAKVRNWLGRPKVWNTITQIAEKLSVSRIIREQELNHIVGISTLPEKQTLLDFRT